MPKFKSGAGEKYFANPAIGKAHEKAHEKAPKHEAPGMPDKGAGHDHAPAHTVTIHHAGAKHHVIGHHDGGIHQTEHESAAEAHSEAKSCAAGNAEGAGDKETGGMQDFMGGDSDGY